jgi:hypothetical protein
MNSSHTALSQVSDNKITKIYNWKIYAGHARIHTLLIFNLEKMLADHFGYNQMDVQNIPIFVLKLTPQTCDTTKATITISNITRCEISLEKLKLKAQEFLDSINIANYTAEENLN